MWPARDAICIACRQVGAACPAGHAQTTSLAKSESRDLLVNEVWGPPNYRRMVKQAARAGATGSGVGGVLTSSCDIGSLDGEVAIFMLILFVVVGGVWLVAKLIGNIVRERRHQLRANGAARKLLPAGFSTGRIGTIVGGDSLPSPLGEDGVAYAVKLTQRGRTMLYDAATIGFEVSLDDNSRVIVPAGPCLIDLVDAPKLAPELYLRGVDPLRCADDEFDPFVHDRAVGRTLQVGDRVEVLGRLIEQPTGGEGGYRDAPATVLVPAGVAALRVR